MRDYDLIIVGAGPAGLSLPRGFAGSAAAYCGLSIEVAGGRLERSQRRWARDQVSPAHPSNGCVHLGAWQRLKEDEAVPSRAEVLDGASSHVLPFTDRDRRAPLGALVSNAALRRTLFDCVEAQNNCDLFAGSTAHVAATNDKRTPCRASGWWRTWAASSSSGPTRDFRACAKARASALAWLTLTHHAMFVVACAIHGRTTISPPNGSIADKRSRCCRSGTGNPLSF